MSLINQILCDNKDASVSQVSDPKSIGYFRGYSIQAYISGSAAGTIWLEGSDDPGVDDAHYVGPATNWVIIKDTNAVLNSAAPYQLNAGGVYYSWVKAVYTVTSGTGTIKIVYNSKDSV